MPLEKTSHGIHLGFTVSTTREVEKVGGAISSLCVSYPKAGRTWLRFMLGHYLSGEQDSRLHVGFTHDGADGLTCDFRPSWYSTYPIVVLVRDPRDIVVSHYFQITRRDYRFGHMRSADLDLDYPISEFIRRPDTGIDCVIAFYNRWALVHRALIVTYERMMCDSALVLHDVLRFLNIATDPCRVSNAVAESGFDRMRERERNHPTSSGLLRPGDPSDPESYKVRRGKVGGYLDHLTLRDVRFVNSRLNEALLPHTLRESYCDHV